MIRRSRRGLKNDLTGRRFGKLVVLRRTEDKDYGGRFFINYLCKCDCGNDCEVISSNLLNTSRSGTKSCGCLSKKPEGMAKARQVYIGYKNKARDRTIEFNISFEQFLEISQKNCEYCGASPSNIASGSRNNGVYIYSGLDREDNNIGYEYDNLAPCCWTCNNGKAQMLKEEFLEWVEQIYNHSVITAIV